MVFTDILQIFAKWHIESIQQLEYCQSLIADKIQ